MTLGQPPKTWCSECLEIMRFAARVPIAIVVIVASILLSIAAIAAILSVFAFVLGHNHGRW